MDSGRLKPYKGIFLWRGNIRYTISSPTCWRGRRGSTGKLYESMIG